MTAKLWGLLVILPFIALAGCNMPTLFTKAKMNSPSVGVFESILDTTAMVSCHVVVGMPLAEGLHNGYATIEIDSKSKSSKHTIHLSAAEKTNWLSPKGLESLIVYSVPLNDFGKSRAEMRVRVSMSPPSKDYSMWICYTSR